MAKPAKPAPKKGKKATEKEEGKNHLPGILAICNHLTLR